MAEESGNYPIETEEQAERFRAVLDSFGPRRKLADLLGVKPQAVSKWAADPRKVNSRRVEAICAAAEGAQLEDDGKTWRFCYGRRLFEIPETDGRRYRDVYDWVVRPLANERRRNREEQWDYDVSTPPPQLVAVYLAALYVTLPRETRDAIAAAALPLLSGTAAPQYCDCFNFLTGYVKDPGLWPYDGTHRPDENAYTDALEALKKRVGSYM